MDADLQQQLTLAAVAMSGAALCFSLLAAFPGLKSVLAALRDGALWFCLFLVLGAGGFLAWQQATQPDRQASAAARSAAPAVTADSAPQGVP